MKKIIAIVLIAVLTVGLIFAITSPFIGIGEEPSKEKIPFGGITLYNLDFTREEPISYYNAVGVDTGSWTFMDTLIVPKYGKVVIDGKTNILMTDFQGGKTDPYLRIGNSGKRVLLADYSVQSFDFDVEMTESYPFQIDLQPDFRGNVYTDNAKGTNGKVTYKNGAFYDSNMKKIMSYDSTRFHFTYIMLGDIAHIYVNGVYLISYNNIIAENVATYTNGFDFHLICEGAASGTHAASIDNFVWNAFSLTYDGAIFDIFEEPRINLKNNPDTVLGGAMND